MENWMENSALGISFLFFQINLEMGLVKSTEIMEGISFRYHNPVNEF